MSFRLRIVSEYRIVLKCFQTLTTTNAVKKPGRDSLPLLFTVYNCANDFEIESPLVFPSKTIVLYVRNLPLCSMDIDQIFFAYICLRKCKSYETNFLPVCHSKMSLTHCTAARDLFDFSFVACLHTARF